MALHDDVAGLRAARTQNGGVAVPAALQGVTKEKIRRVLGRLDLGDNADLVDGVFALLDDQTDSWFSKAAAGTKFSHGASTAHLACHIGILQRGSGKLDREGRDYWIKPLRELGGIEPILLHGHEFIHGHVVAKSPNSSYRLVEDFKAILQAPDDQWPGMLAAWAQQDAARRRREFQAAMAEASRQLVDTGHSDLIRASIEHYAARFLPGFEVVYVDDGDGDRITDEDREVLSRAGIELRLGDAMPDVLLWNPETDRLWVIEAVTSDGEVDLHKVNQLRLLAARCGKAGIDFTTAYPTWKEAASRQGAQGNVAVGSYIWIQSDPAKHFWVGSFE
ncbi:BsuBI/PstI family type II restriction endonuclease [Burkholderia pseudomallei]|uniref:BsuBI/PstI family type II restriction endonuclease n=1 Tax=Burkholderia pseudomallei TaxID=28450 RepID=UPI00050FA4F2|nr:BsuBI/PstI family type II restriction endonuclease [Burkholderia pseudomallei]KGD47177.1 bsuBI/PstI restriction endonuclease family protein [Burkholderia pseudomallei]